MATKTDCFFLNNNPESVTVHNCQTVHDNQYSNLNLNQNLKCLDVSSIQSNSKSYNNKNCGTAATLKLPGSSVSDNIEGKENPLQLNKPSKISDFSNLINDKTEPWKTNSYSNTINSSTIPLHIAAYENSAKTDSFNGSKNEDLQKGKSDSIKNEKQIFTAETTVIQNSFEFQRQENEGAKVPEVSSFKASQRLLNPNKATLNGQGVGEEFQLFLTIGLLFLTSYIFLLSCHPFRNRRHQRRGEITDPQEKNEEKKDSKLEEEESAAKAVKENIQNLPITTNEYENEEVSFNQYQNSEEQIKKYITVIDEFSTSVCQKIESLMSKGDKVVLMEMFGLGNLKDDISMIQFQVSLKILKHFKTKYENVLATSREPLHGIAEKQYLERYEIEAREPGFSANDYLEASKGTQSPILLCFMVHGWPEMYEDFIKVHYDHLQQVIMIGNKPTTIRKTGRTDNQFKNVQMLDEVFATTDLITIDATKFEPKYPFTDTAIYKFQRF